MPSSPPIPAPGDLFCANCGYDLRAATENRCSECGTPFDPAELRDSKIPFATARKKFDVRAYVRTVWMVSMGRPALKDEASRPQNLLRARRFRLGTAILMGMVLMGIYAGLALTGVIPPADKRNVVAPAFWYGVTPGGPDGPIWLLDLLVPVIVGTSIPFLTPILMFVLGMDLVFVVTRLFRHRRWTAAAQERSLAMGCYATSGFPFLLLMVLLSGILLAGAAAAGFAIGAIRDHVEFKFSRSTSDLIDMAGAVLAGIIICLPLLWGMWALIGQQLQWAYRVRWHVGGKAGGIGRILWDLIRLLAGWLGSVLFWLALVPGFIGFLWTVIDSLG